MFRHTLSYGYCSLLVFYRARLGGWAQDVSSLYSSSQENRGCFDSCRIVQALSNRILKDDLPPSPACIGSSRYLRSTSASEHREGCLVNFAPSRNKSRFLGGPCMHGEGKGSKIGGRKKIVVNAECMLQCRCSVKGL